MLGTLISPDAFNAALRKAESAPRWLDIDDEAMRGYYNKSGFLMSHRLQEHPLFTSEALFQLCRRMDKAVKFRFGKVPVDAHFDQSLGAYRGDLTLDDAIERLIDKRAYIAIYNPERDAQYRPVIEGLVAEIGLAARPFERSFNWYSTYVFISANDSVTRTTWIAR